MSHMCPPVENAGQCCHLFMLMYLLFYWQCWWDKKVSKKPHYGDSAPICRQKAYPCKVNHWNEGLAFGLCVRVHVCRCVFSGIWLQRRVGAVQVWWFSEGGSQVAHCFTWRTVLWLHTHLSTLMLPTTGTHTPHPSVLYCTYWFHGKY